MNTDLTTQSETLDQVLIQCLRIFARHGRKIRNQKNAINRQYQVTDPLPIKQKNTKEKEPNQK